MALNYFRQAAVLLLLMLVQLSNAYGHDTAFPIFVDKNYPPYMYEAENDSVAGLYAILLKEIIKDIEPGSKLVAVPWKRALLYGSSGMGAIGGAYKNDKRSELYDFSMPIYTEKMVVFVNKDKQFEFNGLDDLAGKMIGVNRGWSYGQKFDEARQGKLFEVNVRSDLSDNFEMLALGRIDCLVLDKLSGESYIQRLDLDDKIISLPVPLSMNNSYLITAKQLKAKDFLTKFDASLEKMRKNGIYEALVQNFIDEAQHLNK